MPASHKALERLTKSAALDWQPSQHTKGWEYVLLNGCAHSPLQGPFTVLCRWSGAIHYAPWVSDADVEYFALEGELTVNNHVLSPGDHSVVPPATETCLSTRHRGQALCLTRGKVVWAVDIFRMFPKLRQEDAQKLLRLPWIDHLRSQLREEDLGLILATLRRRGPAKVKELAISMARKFSGPPLNEAILAVHRTAEDLSLRVSTTLYLNANAVITQQDLKAEIKTWEQRPMDLLAVVRQFYSAKTNRDLARIVRARWPKMPLCNRPFHKLIVRLAEKHADDQ